MRLLLTNDDGIRAPGIVALHHALTTPPLAADLLTVAPLTIQSATGHGVTFHAPIMSAPITVNERLQGVSVDGRPADCVKVAVANIWPARFGPGARPDLLISGMNAGANCGINTIYSGTVAAALEAAFLGVPAIAVSLRLGRGRPLFDVAAAWARATLDRLLKDGLPSAHECLSINLPLCEEPWKDGERRISKYETAAYLANSAPRPLPPIRVCPMNVHGLIDKYDARRSPGGDDYYWAAGGGLDFKGTDPGSDVDELMKGHITITPLTFDLTHHATLEAWRARL